MLWEKVRKTGRFHDAPTKTCRCEQCAFLLGLVHTIKSYYYCQELDLLGEVVLVCPCSIVWLSKTGVVRELSSRIAIGS